MWKWHAGHRKKQKEDMQGVSHIDAERVNQDDAYAEHIVEYAKKSGVEISALAYYPNVMAADKEKSKCRCGASETGDSCEQKS